MNDGTEPGPRRGTSRTFEIITIPSFLREMSGSWEMAFENADLYLQWLKKVQ